MKSFRGEIPGGHPKFASTPAVAVTGGTPSSLILDAPGPVDIDTPAIMYTPEDDKAIDEYVKATGEFVFSDMN